jgi:hypothetical protein
MDQPFDSDVMEDLDVEIPVSSADEALDGYEGMEESFEEGFEDNHAFSDEMDGYDAEGYDAEGYDAEGFYENDAFTENLEGDLWDDSGESGDGFKPHHTNQRESNRTKHDEGQARRRRDRGGERGDVRRREPRRRPPGHRGAWAPQNKFSDEFSLEEGNEFEDGFENEFENEFEDNFGDGFASGDEFAEGESVNTSVNAMDGMADAIADALEAEDSHEFLRRMAQGVRQAGRVAGIARRLVADGADEFEALDEMLAFAETEAAIDAAVPMIAGLTIRTTMPQVARLNRTVRRQLVRSVAQSTQTLARRQGAQAVRAIPRVIQAVQRTAQRQRIPARQLPQAVRRTMTRVVQNPRLVSRLAQATRQAASVTRRYSSSTAPGMPRRLVIRGPVEITIRSR